MGWAAKYPQAVMQSPLPGAEEYRAAVEPFRHLHEMKTIR
jgi:hypothetical protein